MHRCPSCQQRCTCSGDTGPQVVALEASASCNCCCGACVHGADFDEHCACCAVEGFQIEDIPPQREAPAPFLLKSGQ